MDFVVTTVLNPAPSVIDLAREIADHLCIPLVIRSRYSLAAIKEQCKVDNIIVAAAKGPMVYTPSGEYFFHLSMAELRIKNIINGKPDHMITAMGLTAGMSVLDCTLGLATDAVVASFVAGESGMIMGLEVTPVISLITGYGLQTFIPNVSTDCNITSALRRITVKNADYNHFLSVLPAKCIDIVYFDPMFRQPIYKSSNLQPVRSLADKRPLEPEAIRNACRVAKRRVVVKEAAFSSEFARLGIGTVVGGKYSSIKYGIIECAQQPSDTAGG